MQRQVFPSINIFVAPTTQCTLAIHQGKYLHRLLTTVSSFTEQSQHHLNGEKGVNEGTYLKLNAMQILR